MATQKAKATTELNNVSNDAADFIAAGIPYMVDITIEGVCPLIFHRYSVESVAEKTNAAKNSKAKKTDDLESYVYRDDEGFVCLPVIYVIQSVCGKDGAAKFRQDPRSPRASALKLYKAAVIPVDELARITRPSYPEGTKEWDMEDTRRVCVQQAAISRTRPAFKTGWQASFRIMVTMPEYVSPADLHHVLTQAGICVGTGNFRPTYGRYKVNRFELVQLED